MNKQSITKLLVVSALCGASSAFAPPQSTKSLSVSVSPFSSQQLHVFNPFASKQVVPEEIIPVEPVPGPLDTRNYVAAGVWVALIAWAFLAAPGELSNPADTELVTLLVTQPTPRPDSVNELFFTVWNCFAVVPLVLGALEAPVGKGQRLPATPFLLGSGAFGYFALGPYFATRTVREEYGSPQDMGFFSRNVFESKIFAGLVSAVALSIPFTSDILNCDLPATIAGFSQLFQSSKFVSVSTVDISIMSALAAVLVSEDAKRRGWEDKSTALLAATLLLPVVGPSLYLLARPSLEEE